MSSMVIYVGEFGRAVTVCASPAPARVAVGIRLGGSIPNRAGCTKEPGFTGLNSNKLPNKTCWMTGNLASICKLK